jgi:GAF domain-containing protein
MKLNEGQRPFIDKVASDTREYVQALLDDNQRLGRTAAEAQMERDHAKQALEHAIAELNSRERTESELRERVAAIEEESLAFTARYVEVEQQNTHLANLYVASYQLHGTLDRERVLAAIKEVVINLIGSEEVGIWELDARNNALALLDSFGIDERQWTKVALDAEAGLVGLVAETGARFVAGEAELVGSGAEADLSACIPLKLDDTVIGVIGIFNLLPQKSGFEPIDLELFELLASHAATALYCTRATSRLTVVS